LEQLLRAGAISSDPFVLVEHDRELVGGDALDLDLAKVCPQWSILE
jgi:hypothetical protein